MAMGRSPLVSGQLSAFKCLFSIRLRQTRYSASNPVLLETITTAGDYASIEMVGSSTRGQRSWPTGGAAQRRRGSVAAVQSLRARRKRQRVPKGGPFSFSVPDYIRTPEFDPRSAATTGVTAKRCAHPSGRAKFPRVRPVSCRWPG